MRSISLLITGDFAPQGRILQMVKNRDYEHTFNDFSTYLEKSDINITNLECPLIETGKPIPKIGPALKAPVSSIEILKRGNFNIVTLANNHILDYGIAGLQSTIDICKNSGINTVGAGLTKYEVTRPIIYRIGNKTIGFINVAENEFSIVPTREYGANPIDIPEIYNKINELKNSVDSIIIIVHGGHEFYKYPSPEIVKHYRMLIDFGANAVVGHHPHCYSGYETYNEGLIFYSLGNFSFDWPDMRKTGWNEGYAVNLKLNNNNKLDFDIIPYKQGTTNTPGIRLLKYNEANKFNNDLAEINTVIASEELLMKQWHTYIKNMESKYMMLIQPTNRWIKALQARNYLPTIFFKSKRNRLTLLNLIRCESHREILTNILNTIKKN